MNDETKRGAPPPKVAEPAAYPKDRAAFKTLLLANPNYFGNRSRSASRPSSTFSSRRAGYGSDVCGPGTPEYVRFYLSFDGGASWQDQGLTSFRADDIPAGTDGRKRLEYAVSLAVDPHRRFCRFDPLIRVRAILSWNNPPPPNQPNWYLGYEVLRLCDLCLRERPHHRQQ